MQLAVDVQIPVALGGVGGECLYMDTEGSFVVDRIVDMATAVQTHLRSIATTDDERAAAAAFDVVNVLQRIHVMRVHDHVEQLAAVHSLAARLRTDPTLARVRLVVLDSVAFHFRQDFEDFSLRLRLLNGMATALSSLAEHFNVAVLLTNQVTTRVAAGERAHFAPALGDSWGHACTNRVMLHWHAGCRHAQLLKSPCVARRVFVGCFRCS